MKRFAIRTINNGCIVIDGREYRPDERFMKYDGRLDGLRYAFGLYYGADDKLENFVSLWGSEQSYKDTQHIEYGPELVDSFFPWEWWRNNDKQAHGSDRASG